MRQAGSRSTNMSERKKYLGQVRSVVVKLGTQSLSDAQGRLDAAFLADVADQIVALRQRRIAVTVVSSGAIGAGIRELDLPGRPRDMAQLQAVAAVGQRRLMDAWADAFAPHRVPVAQLLLTREDVDKRKRFLNLRNTLNAIHELRAVPIINENDSVSTDEIIRISFGDNDILAALVAYAFEADLLVLLTVVDGLLDASGKPVRLVTSIEQARTLVREEKSAMGRGGMDSKLQAAAMVTRGGHAMVVADGRCPRVLLRIIEGEDIGTLFAPSTKPGGGRRVWIRVVRPAGTIVVDAGAAVAVAQRNKSLLPAGVMAVEGDFDRGDVVRIEDPQGRVIARGLTNYSADHIEQIRGKRSAEVRAMLGDEAYYEEVIHRNNLIVE